MPEVTIRRRDYNGSLRLFLAVLLVMSSSAALSAPRRHAVAPPVPCFSAILAEAATGTGRSRYQLCLLRRLGIAGASIASRNGRSAAVAGDLSCCEVTQMAIDADHVYVAMRRHGEAIQAPNDKWLYDIVLNRKGQQRGRYARAGHLAPTTTGGR